MSYNERAGAGAGGGGRRYQQSREPAGISRIAARARRRPGAAIRS